jgi:hypothetical protein
MDGHGKYLHIQHTVFPEKGEPCFSLRAGTPFCSAWSLRKPIPVVVVLLGQVFEKVIRDRHLFSFFEKAVVRVVRPAVANVFQAFVYFPSYFRACFDDRFVPVPYGVGPTLTLLANS